MELFKRVSLAWRIAWRLDPEEVLAMLQAAVAQKAKQPPDTLFRCMDETIAPVVAAMCAQYRRRAVLSTEIRATLSALLIEAETGMPLYDVVQHISGPLWSQYGVAVDVVQDLERVNLRLTIPATRA